MNDLEEFLIVERDDKNQLTVEGSKIIDSDIMATNGVVHVIDNALMPNEGKGKLYSLKTGINFDFIFSQIC